MSAQILRAAATKLREACDEFSDALASGPHERIEAACKAVERLGFDSPPLARLIADWLDATASTEASYFDDSHALAVARSIVGEPS